MTTDDFPVTFADPAHAELTWEWDDMHMPFALTPLAGDFVLAIVGGFAGWYRYADAGFGPFPQRWYAAIWNGYTYMAIDRGVPESERPALTERMTAMSRWRIPATEAYWRDELIPELRSLYATIDGVPVEAASGAAVADGWEAAWAADERAWNIHFDVILGAYQVMEDLGDMYEKIVPGAPPGEAMRLIQGARTELYETEVGAERLAALAAATPAVAAALKAGNRKVDELAAVPGGAAFVTKLEAYLAEHGHLGQSVDDLSLASWIEEPGLFLTELEKRLEHSPELAETRRARLAADADALADAARAKLADRPDDLAAFERLLGFARRVGPITETHNYWIDRRTQSRIRTLAMRIGRRFVRDGVLDLADDVFYLHRSEVATILRSASPQQALVETRRAEHELQRALKPPATVGKPAEAKAADDRFEGTRIESTEPDVLRGTGSSAGIYRGPARVVLSSTEFNRIKPGDIIVCPSSNPSWVPVFTIAGGLVTNTGGVLSHAAVVAREFGLPAVTGVAGATTTIRDGQTLEIDGTAGTVRLL